MGTGGLPLTPVGSSKRRMAPIRPRTLRVELLPFLITDELRDGNLARAVNDSLALALGEFHSIDVVRVESLLGDASGPYADPEESRADCLEYMVEGAVFSERGLAQ